MIFGRKVILLFLITLISNFSLLAQDADLSNLKWWIGLKSGVTFSQVKQLQSYSVISHADAEKDNAEEKKYAKTFSNFGQTVGLMFGYAFTQQVLLTFQPSYSNYKYSYTTQHNFGNETGDAYAISTKQNHRLGYIELPITLLLRVHAGRLEPYVNFGWYYGVFAGGRKRLKYTETITEAGVSHTESEKTERIAMGDFLMKSQMGLTGGVGLGYMIQYFRIGMELTYRQGQYNITNEKNRYSDKVLINKFFEVPDDLKLNQFELTLNMFMPVDNLIHLHKGRSGGGGRGSGKKAWNSTKD